MHGPLIRHFASRHLQALVGRGILRCAVTQAPLIPVFPIYTHCTQHHWTAYPWQAALAGHCGLYSLSLVTSCHLADRFVGISKICVGSVWPILGLLLLLINHRHCLCYLTLPLSTRQVCLILCPVPGGFRRLPDIVR